MVEINYRALKNYLIKQKENSEAEGFAPVYLIYGDELMCKTACEVLLNVLIPEAKKSLNYDSIDGSGDQVQQALEKVNTYSLVPGKKVVVINDAEMFYTKQNEVDLIKKSKEAFAKEDMDNAAKYFLNVLGLSNLTFDDIAGENRSKLLKLDDEKAGGDEWLDQIIGFCTRENLSIPSAESMDKLTQEAIQRGFPKDNHLIMTTDMVDRRRKLFKVISQHGVVIDCSVPIGERRADKIAQKEILEQRMSDILAKSDVTLDEDAYQAVVEMTGFDLRTFSNGLQKLMDYVGDRKKITAEDVRSVLKRSKKDPLFELTNAVSGRDVEGSLFFLGSLLTDGIHPLQMLAAITNQMRKMLLIKGFCESAHGRFWQTGMRYDQFKRRAMPAIQAYDSDLQNELIDWDGCLTKEAESDEKEQKQKRSKKKHKPDTDLVVSRQPQNPYPVFQMFLKSEMYTTEELIGILEALSQTDFRLKSSRQAPKLILEELIIRIIGERP